MNTSAVLKQTQPPTLHGPGREAGTGSMQQQHRHENIACVPWYFRHSRLDFFLNFDENAYHMIEVIAQWDNATEVYFDELAKTIK